MAKSANRNRCLYLPLTRSDYDNDYDSDYDCGATLLMSSRTIGMERYSYLMRESENRLASAPGNHHHRRRELHNYRAWEP